MSIYSKLYWLTRLDGIQSVSIVIIVLGIVAILAIWLSFDVYIWSYSDDIEEEKHHKSGIKWMKIIACIVVLFTLVKMFVPSKKDVIFIIAGGKTIEFIQSDTSINKIPEQTTKYVSEFLEQQINELENTNKESEQD